MIPFMIEFRLARAELPADGGDHEAPMALRITAQRRNCPRQMVWLEKRISGRFAEIAQGQGSRASAALMAS